MRRILTTLAASATLLAVLPTGAVLAGTTTQEPTQYTIRITTSDFDDAGTNALVSLDLFGTNGGFDTAFLDNPNVDDFERGNTDEFQVTSPIDLGGLTSINVDLYSPVIGTLNPRWRLSHVVVSTGGQSWTFAANRWINPNELARVDITDNPVEYKITVKTSDIANAGTDANIKVSLHSDLYNFSPWFELDNRFDNFERNSEDVFYITTKRMTAVQLVKVNFDDSGANSGWHLEYVEVTTTDVSDSPVLKFPFHQWFESAGSQIAPVGP